MAMLSMYGTRRFENSFLQISAMVGRWLQRHISTRCLDVIHFTSWPVPVVRRGDKLKVPVKVSHQLLA